jgi:hypothetical protein
VRGGLFDQSAFEPVRLLAGMCRDHDLGRREVRQRVRDRQHWTRISDIAASADAAIAQFRDGDLDAFVCARDGLVDVRGQVTQARVEGRGHDEDIRWPVGCTPRDLVAEPRTRALPVRDHEDSMIGVFARHEGPFR